MKYFLVISLFLIKFGGPDPDLYLSKNVRISLYSHALIEDIKAETSSGLAVYNAATGELDFSVNISSFRFEKAFMQQHFNSDYMESDKYPKAIFKGKLLEHVDLAKDGTYHVNAAGEFTVHGVSRGRTIPGILTIKNGIVSMSSEFTVNCADHHVDIPQILFYHIAESIKITVSATYNPYQNVAIK
jgi:polyisoprenoid-binding protein YceI